MKKDDSILTRCNAEGMRQAREMVGDTQTQAAARLYVGLRTFKGYEGGRAIPRAMFELYLLKTGLATIKAINTLNEKN